MKFAAFALAALALAVPAARAESVDCPDLPPAGEFFPPGTLCRSIPRVLDDLEWPRTSTEVTSNELTIPGGDDIADADLTFDFVHDDGDFNFCFGFCLEANLNTTVIDNIRAEVATSDERLEFAKNCILDNGVAVFDDLEHDDGHQTIIPGVPVPSNVIFFLIPNNPVEDFAADPETFWANERQPLFSLSGANPEYLDQLVLFQSGSNTAFAWEDKTRVKEGGDSPVDSDEDFGDLVFKVNTLINPTVPSGCPADCDSTTAEYVEGGDALATSDGNCACLSFEC